MSLTRLLALVTLLLGIAAAQPPPPPLVLAPEATIIVLPAARAEREQRAALLLQEWLRKAYRTEQGFTITGPAAQPADKVIIALGATTFSADIDTSTIYRDGFRIRRQGNVISIVGGSDAGTFFGAAHFLDKFAAVRFYMPGDLFTSLPSEPRVEIPSVLDITIEPYVKNSLMSGIGGFRGTGGLESTSSRPEEFEWIWRNAIFRKDSLYFSHQHSMFERFPPEKFARKYPEIYPVLDGKRYVPSDPADQGWQPCFSEPKLLDAAVESAIAFFKANPERTYLSYSVQDSHRFCEDERCLRAIEQAGGDKVVAYTNLNARFLNSLAERLEKELPRHSIPADKKIVYIPYTMVRETPPFRLHPNILPVVVFTIGDAIIDRRLEPGSNILEQWAAVATQMGNHDWGQGKWYFIPRTYTKLTSRVLREAKQRGLVWGYQHFEAYPNWGLDGPKLWITSRLWWNPDTDVESLWRQLAADLFPAAHSEMFQYFMNLEYLWNLMSADDERKLKRWRTQFDLRSDEQKALARDCRQLLDRAASKAQGVEKERIKLFSKSYRLTEHFFTLANADSLNQTQVDAARSYARDVIAADPMTVFSGGNSEELMQDIDAALAVVTKGKVK